MHELCTSFESMPWNIQPDRCIFSVFLTPILNASMYSKTSNKWNIPWYNTRERCITVLYHGIENTKGNTINGTYTRRMMGRLDGIASNMQQLSCRILLAVFLWRTINVDIGKPEACKLPEQILAVLLMLKLSSRSACKWTGKKLKPTEWFDCLRFCYIGTGRPITAISWHWS